MPGFITLIAFTLAGEAAVQALGLHIPGSIIGLLLLLACLTARPGRLPAVEASARDLLRFLPLFLVPVGVAVVSLASRAEAGLPMLVLTLMVALVLAVVIVSTLMRLAMRRAG